MKIDYNHLATQWFESKVKLDAKEISLSEFNKYQNYCFNLFKPIVMSKAKRYKQFDNFDDLVQEGYTAVLEALKTYDIKKGNFYSWALLYVKTKISRAASKHSTIKIPIQKAWKIKPTKVTNMPEVLDDRLDAQDQLIQFQDFNLCNKILEGLDEKQKQTIELLFGFNEEAMNLEGVGERMGVSRSKAKSEFRRGSEKMLEGMIWGGVV